MRAFLALDLSDPMRRALGRVQDALPVGRMVDEDNLHLTLAFLDDRSEAELRGLHDLLAEIAPQPVTLKVSGVVVFGGGKPRLVAADVVRSAGLAALHDRVNRAVRQAGIDVPRSRFRPHITLARFGARQSEGERLRLEAALADLAGLSLPMDAAGDLVLYRSTLTEAGPIYDALARYPMEAGDESDLV